MMPLLCWARCLTKTEEVVLVMTVSKSCIKSSGSCAACCIVGDFPVFWRKNEDFGVTGLRAFTYCKLELISPSAEIAVVLLKERN